MTTAVAKKQMDNMAHSVLVDDDALLPIIGVTAVAYVALEAIHHVVIGTWLTPYLISIGASATTASTVGIVLISLCVLGVGWGLWKLFKKKSE